MAKALTQGPLDSVGEKAEYLRFEDQDHYALSFNRIDFNRCEWINTRIKNARFTELSLIRWGI